jgi:hypothetical protein
MEFNSALTRIYSIWDNASLVSITADMNAPEALYVQGQGRCAALSAPQGWAFRGQRKRTLIRLQS